MLSDPSDRALRKDWIKRFNFVALLNGGAEYRCSVYNR